MKYFFETYILVNFKDYFGNDLDVQPMLWLLFLIVGVCAACFVLHFEKNAQYALVKQLVRHKATTPETAKTLKALGLDTRRSLCSALRRGGPILRAIDRVGHEELTYEQYVAMQKDREKRAQLKTDACKEAFYISEGKRAAAEHMLAQGSASILRPIALSAAVLIFYLALALVMPSLLSLLAAL